MNQSLSCVSSTESLYQFQTTGVWLTAAIFLIPKLFCWFIAIVLFLWWKVQTVPYFLYSLIPFFLRLLECWKADPRYMLFHQHTLAHSTQRLTTAACERLAASASTPNPSPFPALACCAIHSLKSHQGCNPETVLQFPSSASPKLLLN